MAEATIQLGGGNWAGKTDNLLGYYKEGERFYKQDFTFSRSTTGTYTDSDGYIQEMPYNLVTYSEQFDNAAWTTLASGENIVINSVISPDGTLNADTLEGDGSSTNVYVRQDITLNTSTDYTFSIFAKKGTNDFLAISAEGYSGATNTIVIFDLNNGAVTTGTANIEDYGNGWFRCSYTIPISTDGSGRFLVYTAYNGTTRGFPTSSDANGQNIYLYGAQLVKGTSAKTYFPTTTRLNMPRVDYLNNSNGSLILEPQRSNLITHSSDLDNAAWTKSGTTITANDATSPDGTTNADKIIASSGLSIKIAYQVISSTNGVAHTVSAFYKADEYSYAFLRVGGQTPSPYVIYNLSNQSVVSTANATSTKIEDYGSGWYRVSMTYTANSATNAPNVVFLPTSGYTLDSSNQPSYNGDGSSGGYVYGVQLEANASYPTTLINTSGSSVTRNADACSISNVADRIGQTEGTIFLDITRDSLESYTQRIFTLSDGTTSNIIGLQLTAANQITFYVENGGTNQVIITKNDATTANQKVKIAAAYKENDFVLYIDGTQVGVDTSGSVPTTSVIKYANANGSFQYVGSVNNTKIYNTRLSNSELATLTTL